jgi:hypothetical protein
MAAVDRDAEAAAYNQRRGDQREGRQADVVGDRDSRIVGEHGDEMRRPDACAGGRSRRPGPYGPCPPAVRFRAVEHADCGQARQEADDGGERHQAPVMLDAEAIENPVHGRSPLSAAAKITVGVVRKA